MDNDGCIGLTQRWLERSVIGLNLCPFAESVYRARRVHFCVSAEESEDGLEVELRRELRALQAADPLQRETTLLIHPAALTDFGAYNDFLGVCDAVVADLGLQGELQVASFHPHYQFAGTQSDDIENFTNRSPYPMLHLLRESSIERAVASAGDIDEIYKRNIRTLRRLGHDGWRRLWLE
jgi:uncharacterized protein